jgi:Spy/CpxP family protein refolding chaperone
MKRKLFLTLVAGLLMATGLMAQNQPPRQDFQQRRQQQLVEMKKELTLSKDQITKFDAIQKEFNDKMTKARESAGDDREAMRSKMQEMNKERDTKIEKILTPDQVKKFKDILAKQAAARQQRGPGGGGR